MGRNQDFIYKVIENQDIKDAHPKSKNEQIDRYTILHEIK